MPWGAAIAAVGTVAASAIGSQKSGGSSSSQQSDNAPWTTQQPYLETGFKAATQNLQNAQGVPQPTSFVAPQNGSQTSADSAMYGTGMGAEGAYAPWSLYGQFAGQNAPKALANAETTALMGIGPQSSDTSILSNYARTGSLPGNPYQVDPSLSSSITQAGQGAVGSLGTGQSLATQAGQAGLNPNGTINAAVSGAGALSANPYLDAQIDAANRDVNRDLTENTLPQIRAAAMSSGNANSSREGALEAISTRGAADRMADTSAALRGAAYTQGATLGANGYNQGLNTAVSAGSALNANGAVGAGLLTSEQQLQQQQNQFGTTSMLGAANNAATQNLNFQTADTASKLAGNSQFLTGITSGLNATDHTLAGTLTGQQAAYQAGTNDQAGTQAGINDDLADYKMQTQGSSDLLDRYWSVVGGNKGSSSSSTGTQQPNNGGLGGALAGAVGGATAGYGLYKNLKSDGTIDSLNNWLFGSGSNSYTTANGYTASPWYSGDYAPSYPMTGGSA